MHFYSFSTLYSLNEHDTLVEKKRREVPSDGDDNPKVKDASKSRQVLFRQNKLRDRVAQSISINYYLLLF